MISGDRRAAAAEANTTRREFLGCGGLAVLSVLGGGASAYAGSAAVAQSANVRLVNEFCAAWHAESVDAAHLVATYLTTDCTVRFMDGQMLATGVRATAAMFADFASQGRQFELKILETVALGPIVVNRRMDTTTVAGKVVGSDAVAGVFVIAQGKIREWSDYFIPKGT